MTVVAPRDECLADRGGAILRSDADLVDLLTRWSRDPDATAIRMDGKAATYRELDSWSDQLAGQIDALDLPLGAPVGFSVNRCVELPALLLSIVKAGHPWIPITAGWQSSLPATAAVVTGPDTTDLPNDLPTLHMQRADHEHPYQPGARDTITGLLPLDDQGDRFLVDHDQLMALLNAAGEALDMQAGDKVLVTAPTGSARGIADLLLGMLRGAEVTLGEPMPDPRLIADVASSGRRTFLHITPALWYRLLYTGLDHTPGLVAISGGELLSGHLAARLLAAADTVWNGYGPPETGGYALLHRVGSADTEAAIAPVGRPVGSLRPQVLDETGHAADPGQPGELYLADAGLVLARPGQSAAANAIAYRPDRHASAPGDRRIRTRMVATATFDGVLTVHGDAVDPSNDRPGSVRPADAETAALTVPDVALCPVVMRTDDAGRQQLVAYVVVDPVAARPVVEVEEEVSLALSELPVPYRVVLRSHLPLTSTGVVDRSALPDPDATAPASTGRRPQTQEEHIIAGIWAELLGIPVPGADVGFFEAGGYSLAVTRLANRLEQAFGFVVPLAELFEQTTVTNQAQLVERLYERELAQILAEDEDEDEDGRFVDTVP